MEIDSADISLAFNYPIRRLPRDIDTLVYYGLPINMRIENMLSITNRGHTITEYTRLHSHITRFLPIAIAKNFHPIPSTLLEDQLSILPMDELWHVYLNGILNKVYCPASPAISDEFDGFYVSKTHNPSFNILPKVEYNLDGVSHSMDNPIMELFNRFRIPFEMAPYILTRQRQNPEVIWQRKQILISNIMQCVRLLCSLQTHHPEFDYKIRKMVFDFIIGIAVYTKKRYKEYCNGRIDRIQTAIDDYMATIEIAKMKKEEIYQSRLIKKEAIRIEKIRKREVAKENRRVERLKQKMLIKDADTSINV